VLRGPENRDAVGAEFKTSKRRAGRGMERGYPPPQPTRGSGERRKLPQRGPGWCSGRKRILVHFEFEKTNLMMTNYIFFVIFIAHI